MSLPICENCGHPLKENALYCEYCGIDIRRENKKSKTSKKSIVLLSVLIAFVILENVCLILVMKSKNNAENKTEKTSSFHQGYIEEFKTEPEENTFSETFDNNQVDKNIQSNIDVEASVKKIRAEYNNITDSIASNEYSSMKIDDGVTAYFDTQIRCIEVKKGYCGCDFSRYYYYDGYNLIFAYYEREDSHRLYFENGKLIRWRYCPDSFDIENAVNHDLDDIYEYRMWERTATIEAEYFSLIWEAQTYGLNP